MGISHIDIEKSLKLLGCKEMYSVKKVTRYWLPDSKEVFYVENENIHPQIVLHPKMITFRKDLSAITGVVSKEPYYHNDDMTMYPKALKNGDKPSHYGLAFEFDNLLSMESFIEYLHDIVTLSAFVSD